MKNLYTAATTLQLINALNLHCNHAKGSADLLLFDPIFPNSNQVVNRIRQLNLFDKVENIYITGKKTGYMPKHSTIIQKLIHLLRLGIISDYSQLHWSMTDYQQIYTNYPVFLSIARNLDNRWYYWQQKHKRLKGFPQPFILLDEGLGSYIYKCVQSFAPRYRKEAYTNLRIALYHPDLADYYQQQDCTIQSIQPIDIHNKEFIDQLNYIFDYKPGSFFLPDDSIIFFDQPYTNKDIYSHLHKYLQNLNTKRPIYVKLHPRQQQFIKFYEDCGLKIIDSTKFQAIPWELIALNENIARFKMLTVTSTAVCSPFLYLSETDTLQAEFIYPIIANKMQQATALELSSGLASLIERIANKFPEVTIQR